MQKELIIVGIDPGITTAYAILDLNGQLLNLKSSKLLTLHKVIEEIVEVGKVVVVGTDVKYSPHYIEKFATKLNAKLIHPKEDIPVGFKTRITKEFKVRDAHQRDALTAALLAWKEVEPLVKKVGETLKQEGKEHLFDEVLMLTLKGMNIVDAIKNLEIKQPEKLGKKRKKIKIKKSFRIREENENLKKRNETLQAEMEYLKRKIEELEKNIQMQIDQKIKKSLEIKDQKIIALHRDAEQYKFERQNSKKEIDELKKLMFAARTKVIAKKFRNLTQEIIPSVEKGDILFIEDVNEQSERTWDFLKDKVATIIYKQKPSKEVLTRSFNFIDATQLTYIEKSAFVLIEKEELEKEKEKSDILYKIVEEYKEQRERSY